MLNGVGGEEILFCRLPSTIYNIIFLRNLGTFLVFGFPALWLRSYFTQAGKAEG